MQVQRNYRTQSPIYVVLQVRRTLVHRTRFEAVEQTHTDYRGRRRPSPRGGSSTGRGRLERTDAKPHQSNEGGNRGGQGCGCSASKGPVEAVCVVFNCDTAAARPLFWSRRVLVVPSR